MTAMISNLNLRQMKQDVLLPSEGDTVEVKKVIVGFQKASAKRSKRGRYSGFAVCVCDSLPAKALSVSPDSLSNWLTWHFCQTSCCCS